MSLRGWTYAGAGVIVAEVLVAMMQAHAHDGLPKIDLLWVTLASLPVVAVTVYAAVVRQQCYQQRQVIEANASTAHDWVWESDANDRITYSNSAVTELLGYTPAGAAGHADRGPAARRHRAHPTAPRPRDRWRRRRLLEGPFPGVAPRRRVTGSPPGIRGDPARPPEQPRGLPRDASAGRELQPRPRAGARRPRSHHGRARRPRRRRRAAADRQPHHGSHRRASRHSHAFATADPRTSGSPTRSVAGLHASSTS